MVDEIPIDPYREPQLKEPPRNADPNPTGTKGHVIFASAGLIQRMAAEGNHSRAEIAAAPTRH